MCTILAKIDATNAFYGLISDKEKSILKYRESNYESVHTGFKGKTIFTSE